MKKQYSKNVCGDIQTFLICQICKVEFTDLLPTNNKYQTIHVQKIENDEYPERAIIVKLSSILSLSPAFIVHLKINISSTKQKNGSSSQIFKHTHRKQQFVTFPNLSRQAEKRCSDEQKFEGFKILIQIIDPNIIHHTQFINLFRAVSVQKQYALIY
ncbi:Hypothetical_protein [Hexamita inflata]|uniref:Hypothetical_protein n=1 Tax=Hexamita inflata TaxID=28002 RepID=A0AA86RJ51_9EUKA|nr:Hypothetical protein HINF_LOCUS55465 [Hexamita inflata]